VDVTSLRHFLGTALSRYKPWQQAANAIIAAGSRFHKLKAKFLL
jgi:hypothetical protein